MPDYNEYAQRVVNAINQYGETVHLKYRVSTYDPIKGETYKYRRYRNYRVFIRPTDQKDWEQLPEGLKIKDVRKVYFTKPFPKKEVILERDKDNKEYAGNGKLDQGLWEKLGKKAETNKNGNYANTNYARRHKIQQMKSNIFNFEEEYTIRKPEGILCNYYQPSAIY